MRCSECNYIIKKKSQKCPVCGQVFKSVTIGKYESITDPNFVQPEYHIIPKPGTITPKEIYIENSQAKKRGGIFDNIVTGIFGDLFDIDDPKDDERYSALLDDFGDTLSSQAVSGKSTVIDEFKEFQD